MKELVTRDSDERGDVEIKKKNRAREREVAKRAGHWLAAGQSALIEGPSATAVGAVS